MNTRAGEKFFKVWSLGKSGSPRVGKSEVERRKSEDMVRRESESPRVGKSENDKRPTICEIHFISEITRNASESWKVRKSETTDDKRKTPNANRHRIYLWPNNLNQTLFTVKTNTAALKIYYNEPNCI